jgi:hypothetical protein
MRQERQPSMTMVLASTSLALRVGGEVSRGCESAVNLDSEPSLVTTAPGSANRFKSTSVRICGQR